MQRSPRVFIIHAHGIMPVVESTAEDDSALRFKLAVYGKTRPKKVVVVKSLVDTFTTAKFGCAMHTDVRHDPPHVDFIHNLIKHTHDDATKDQLRDMIRTSLCEARQRHHEAMVHHPDTCKFKCHRKGKDITEMNLFGSGEPVIEGIVSLDPQTGNIEDVIEHFGITEKDGQSIREIPVPEHGRMSAEESAEYIAFFQELKSRAESELASLQMEVASMLKRDKNYPMLMHSIHSKTERIKTLDMLMRGMNRESKFEYSGDMKREYGDVIKLSDLIKIGISRNIINPTTDFVVVFSCRVPESELPLGVRTPRAGDETPSVGGRTKSKTYKKIKCNKSKKCKSNKSKKKSCKCST